MKIQDYFIKPIDRNIETVIKADEKNNISDEVAEYVITKEVAKKIRSLFDSYNNYHGVNGVWIAGFFGSGKSHLLKILSYVFENKAHDGYHCGEVFAEKVEGDEILKGDILKACQIPSESVLFNIDQQSMITSKTDANAVLSVFYKMFFDHLGYYGQQQHVAEFEMWLDEQKQYEDFKTAFQKQLGKDWKNARREYFDPAVTDAIAAVLGTLNNADPEKYEFILDTLEDKQQQSIIDFCKRVKKYIDSKPKTFKLNFFVDEVGQYISDNTKLMLNLQTIAETLATVTNGQSWIFVTSQEDIESIVGDMNKKQRNDFSRIQARFNIRVSLTSANIDEVIEKRLLDKNEKAQKLLGKTWETEENKLHTLLSFSDVGVRFKSYKDPKDFIKKFPFVPYQFDLFKETRIALSTHNAFTGKHASVGERSMLGVFQQVVKHIKNKDQNTLVSFDQMFEGIRNELRGEIQNTIILAERNLDYPFAIKVLKALFLVKYYNSFKTTKRNISVLLINDVNTNLKEHEKAIDTALNILENQSYIQRNGELYEFLTNAEKDIEQEIKETDIEEQDKIDLIKEVCFDRCIKDKKIRFAENKQDYEFATIIDDVARGKDKELKIALFTSLYTNYEDAGLISAKSMGGSIMCVRLPRNTLFVKDINLYLQTKKYIKQKRSASNSSDVERILQDKAHQNEERKTNLVIQANNLLAQSNIYINGSLLDATATSDGKTHIIQAFQLLIKAVYPNMRMIGNAVFSDKSITNALRNKSNDLLKNANINLSEAETEMVTYIQRRKRQSSRTSLNDLKEHFKKRPYGWYDTAILYMVAQLYQKAKIEAKHNSNELGAEAFLDALLNTRLHNTIHVNLFVEIDANQVKKLRAIYKEAFDHPCAYNEPKEIASAFKAELQKMDQEVQGLLQQQNSFSFVQALKPLAANLSQWTAKKDTYLLTNTADFEDDLLDAKEDLLDPIKKFMNGEQRNIYVAVKTTVQQQQANQSYLQGNELNLLQALLENPKPYKGNAMKTAKATKDALLKKVALLIELEQSKAIKAVENKIVDLQSMADFKQLNTEEQQALAQKMQQEVKQLQQEKMVAAIRQKQTHATSVIFTNVLNKMMNLLNQKAPVPLPTATGNDAQNKQDQNKEELKPQTTTTSVEEENKPKKYDVKYINRSQIEVPFNKSTLINEADVEAYIAVLKNALLKQIQQNNRISL